MPVPPGSISQPPSTTEPGPPLYCWIINIDRPASIYEFQICFECLDRQSQDRVRGVTRKGTPQEAWASLLGRLIPHIIMTQRGFARGTWLIEGNEEGRKPRILAPGIEKQIGYSTARDKQIVAISFALGREDRVAQVGCDVHRIHLSKHIPLDVYIDSISHKLCDSERMILVIYDLDRERVVGRIAILWTLKEALMKAIGQPLRSGFDWRRVCFDVPAETVFMDGKPMTGWEFRLFIARLPDAGRLGNKTYKYQVACAIHRGGPGNKFTWNQRGEDMDEWLRFLTVDTIMERVWDFDYPHIHQALMQQAQDETDKTEEKKARGEDIRTPPPPPLPPIIPSLSRPSSSRPSRPSSKPSR